MENQLIKTIRVGDTIGPQNGLPLELYYTAGSSVYAKLFTCESKVYAMSQAEYDSMNNLIATIKKFPKKRDLTNNDYITVTKVNAYTIEGEILG